MGIARFLPPGLQPIRLGAETHCFYQFSDNTDRKAQGRALQKPWPSRVQALGEQALVSIVPMSPAHGRTLDDIHK